MPVRAPTRKKGPGFLGTLERPDKHTSTELSIGVNIDGEEIEIPSLVPGLTQTETDYLLQGNKPTKEIIDKAVQHARQRIIKGKSPFAGPGENDMAINAPRRLSRWLEDIKTRLNVPDIDQPHLYGAGEEAGIDYPVGYESTATLESSAELLEADVRGGAFRAPTILRGLGGEEESFNVPAPPPEKPKWDRQKFIEILDEKFGDPEEFDIEGETAQTMVEENRKLKAGLGQPEEIQAKHMPEEVRKAFIKASTEREGTIYRRKYVEKQDKTEHRKTLLTSFDKAAEEAQRIPKAMAEERARQGVVAEYRTPKQPIAKKWWDTKLNKFVPATDEQVLADPERYGMTEETAIGMKKAGGVSIQIGVEKFAIQKDVTAGNLRTQLVGNKRDKKLYEASGKIFNKTNTGNEVAYWKSITPGAERQGVRIIKLTAAEIADGVTPQKIQEFADRNGITVERVINDMRKK